MGRELELKYRADAAVFAVLEQRYAPFDTIAMETAYFDTPAGDLGQKKWMLRRRMENGVSVCTLKVPLADGSRGEWEIQSDSIEEAVHILCKRGCPGELYALTRQGLIQTCGARFTRRAALIRTEKCAVELALDRGVFLAGEKEQPFMELEAEYKEGSEEAALAFAASLAEEFGLIPERKSKVQRALALALQRQEKSL